MKPLSLAQKALFARLGLFYAAAVWGASLFVIKATLTEINPVILTGYRFLLAGLILLVFLLIARCPILVGLPRAAFLATILCLLHVPQAIGLGYTTASNSGFITGLFVAFIPLFLRVIFKRRPTLMEVIASGISLIGLWILTGGLVDINLGDILTLLTAMAYALHVLYSDKYMKAGIDPLIFTCQQFLMVGLMSLLTAAIFGLPFTIGSTTAGGTLILLVLFPTLSAFVIQMLAQKITSPLRVSLIFALQPVFAALFAWTLGGETLVRHRALGGLLIFIALLISGLSSFMRKKSPERE
ncbi:MAG: DMT family transporter [candidate division Zixibacteria bacterium]|nr:DMT family transporter [candidate division Zixibacteria bacterium]